jgi:hypothetical protein
MIGKLLREFAASMLAVDHVLTIIAGFRAG